MPRLARSFNDIALFAVWLVVAGNATVCQAVSCPIANIHNPSSADKAFLNGHFDQAADLYRAELQKAPEDPAAAAGLTIALLQQQKVDEADGAIHAALERNKNSAVLLTALGEVQYREGTPWLAVESLNAATTIDLCLAREHLLSARLNRLDSDYLKAAKELAMAHLLDPQDPVVLLRWLNTLPLAQRVSEAQAYLAGDPADDAEERERLKTDLDTWKKLQAQPRKSCHLVSKTDTTEIPFAEIMSDATHVRAFGLDAKLNDRKVRLEINTGANGLVVTRATAEHAHVVPFPEDMPLEKKQFYRAHADVIKIGELEFHDCRVWVDERLDQSGLDGVIGMDTFSRFLVTLDFPMRKLILGQLPERPDETVQEKPSLETASTPSDSSDDKAGAKEDESDATAASTVKRIAPLGNHHDRYIAAAMKDWTPVYRVGQTLLIPTRINGDPPKLFSLATGSYTTSISMKVAKKVTQVSEREAFLRNRNTSIKVYFAEKLSLQFGGIRQEAHEVPAFEMVGLTKQTGMEISGALGATTLGQVTLSIDYRDALVKLDYDAKRGYKYPGLR